MITCVFGIDVIGGVATCSETLSLGRGRHQTRAPSSRGPAAQNFTAGPARHDAPPPLHKKAFASPIITLKY